MSRKFAALMLASGLAACGEDAAQKPQLPFEASKHEAGELAFEQLCTSCHAVGSYHNGTGPHLEELAGRKAGSVRDYDYSDAMKQSKIVWNSETLVQFLANGRAMVPGSKMVIEEIEDHAMRDAIVYFLLTKEPR